MSEWIDHAALCVGMAQAEATLVLVEHARRQAEYCCQNGCGTGACETCPCCGAGACVSGADGVPDDPEALARWLEVAAEHNAFAAALAKALGSADLVQGDAKLRGNSGDADATENHEDGSER